MNTWSCDEETAKRCVGFGISLFLGLVNENADKVLDEALKLSMMTPIPRRRAGLLSCLSTMVWSLERSCVVGRASWRV